MDSPGLATSIDLGVMDVEKLSELTPLGRLWPVDEIDYMLSVIIRKEILRKKNYERERPYIHHVTPSERRHRLAT